MKTGGAKALPYKSSFWTLATRFRMYERRFNNSLRRAMIFFFSWRRLLAERASHSRAAVLKLPVNFAKFLLEIRLGGFEARFSGASRPLPEAFASRKLVE